MPGLKNLRDDIFLISLNVRSDHNPIGPLKVVQQMCSSYFHFLPFLVHIWMNSPFCYCRVYTVFSIPYCIIINNVQKYSDTCRPYVCFTYLDPMHSCMCIHKLRNFHILDRHFVDQTVLETLSPVPSFVLNSRMFYLRHCLPRCLNLRC